MKQKLIEQLEKLTGKKVVLEGKIRVFSTTKMKAYDSTDVSEEDILSKSKTITVKDSVGEPYYVNKVTLKDGTKGYVWDRKQVFKESDKKQEKFKLDVTIETGDETIMKDFVRMFRCMNWTKVGASRELKMFLDGDGSFRVDIKVNGKDISDAAEEILGKEDVEKTIDEFDNEKLSLGFGA